MDQMWRAADRIVKLAADLTVGTVIVLVHVALADRESTRANRTLRAGQDPMLEGVRRHRSEQRAVRA
jgi:hypothetical protein